MHQPVRAASADEMPILDLTALNNGGDLKPIAEKMRHACVTTGFFYVANHGIPDSVVSGVFDATQALFRSADRAAHAAPHGREISPRVHAAGHQPASRLRARPRRKATRSASIFRSPIPMWPRICRCMVPTAGRPIVHGCARRPRPISRRRRRLGRRLLKVCAVSLDMPEDYFLQFCTKPMVQMRLFHYPPQEPMSDEKAFGVAPHTDYGMITLLLQDPIGGLELRSETANGSAPRTCPARW